MKNRNTILRLVGLLLSAFLLCTLLPQTAPVQAAGTVTTLWNMETLPNDLLACSIAVPYYPDAADYQAGNVTLTAASGKGVNGSKALAITQNGAGCWADVFQIYPERDYGASYDIGDAEMLWFWADARQFSSTVSMTLRVDGRYLYIGDAFYVTSGSSAVRKTISDSWDGIHGNIWVDGGFCGWVGLPFSSFVTRPNSLANLYLSFGASQSIGKTLYLDNFSVSSGTATPGAFTFAGHTVSGKAATPTAPVWDMEALPEDLLKTALASCSGNTRRNVRVLEAEGKGFGGSDALQLLQYGPYDSSDVLTLNTANAADFASNWRSGDMLLFWVDASEYAGMQVSIDLTVGGKALPANTAWYKERSGFLVKAGTTVEPYENAGFGRLTLHSGFCGWLGIPLTNFKGGLHDAGSIRLHLSYSGSDVIRKSVYLDEFRVITGNRLPDGTATGAGTADVTTVVNADTQPNTSSYLNANVGTTYQTMQAYGASDCWWTTVIGERSNIADLLELVWGKNGAGLNNYRLNVGGSVQYSRSDAPIYFSRAVLSPLNEAGQLDITRNAGSWATYEALLDLIDAGKVQIDDFTLFMNSPPSNLTANGYTCADSLPSSNYTAYAQYVADVVAAYEATGLHVKYVSPINEPLSGNWTGNPGQEGTVYTQVSELNGVYEKVIQKLNQNGATTKVSPADFCNWDYTSRYFSSIVANSTIRNNVDHISGHDYGLESASYRSNLANQIHNYGLSVHMTEWAIAQGDNADTMDAALNTAKTIYTDLTSMNCDTWSWWLACGGGGYADGIVYYSQENNIYETNLRLWAMGNFAQFTTGATRIGVNTSHLPSGLSAMAFRKNNSLIYTVINENYSGTSLSLAGLPAGAQGKMYVTSDEYRLEQIGYAVADNAVTLPARSIVTFVFDNINLNAVSSSAAPRAAASVNGSVLNMENGSVADGFAANQPTLVSAYTAAGKGYGGSAAAALSYNVWNSSTYWDAAFRLSPAAIGGSSNWSYGDTLWFWVDSSDFADDFYLQVDVSDGTSNCQIPIGSTWYLWDGTNAPSVQTSIKTWDGATYGRLLIPADYQGFVGIPMSSYVNLNRSSVQQILFYFEAQYETLPAVLYLDEFWLTANGSTPPVSVPAAAPVTKDIFDMETLAEDLSVNSAYSTWGGSLGTNVDAVVGTDRGFNGSYALGYRYIGFGQERGQNALQIDTAGMIGFDRNFTGGEYFWFWVDAGEFTNSFQLAVMLDWADIGLGNTAKYWSGGAVTTAAIPHSYNDVARVNIPAGYCGFVGLPLDGYTASNALIPSNIYSLVLYFDPGASALPATLWLDEFWITDADGLPDVSFCTHAYTYTDNGDGTHTAVCTSCGVQFTQAHEYVDNVCVCGAAMPPELRSAALVLNGKLDLVYTACVPAGYTGVQMVFTGPNGTQTVSDYTVDGSGNYCFTYTGITPQCMGDNISATLYATNNGRTVSDTLGTYSVRQYCVNKLKDSNTDAALRTLLSDLLAYGAAAQNYTGYRTNALVTSGSDIQNPTYSVYSALSGLQAVFGGTAVNDLRWLSAGLTLNDGVAMTFRFYAQSIDGLRVKLTVGRRNKYVSSKDFAAVAGLANVYEVTLTDLTAAQFGDTVTASFLKSNAAYGQSVSCAVNTYVCAKQNDANANLQALVKALYNYGAAVKAYLQ